MNDQRFFGKYRGIVSSVDDPLFTGRIKAKVPDVMGDTESGWALPCAPYGGKEMGFFCLPAEGANVWIEFEHGDPDYPVWTGCFWGAATDMPPTLNLPDPYKKIMLQTDGGHRIALDDTPAIGGISLETSDGMKITMNATGITLDNGMGAKIELLATTVLVNDDGLMVI
ncbi:MAG: hypothetical protein JWM87_244 [Candidatus Eremiobacteraeota bacterium]|nr:hypothetical protein [Candidatus Eremiobacteraeota bacterium]